MSRVPPESGRGYYRVIVHPYRSTRGPSGGPWLVRCYTEGGEHVHSAEGGVSLHGGLDEVKRAIERREAASLDPGGER